MKCKFVLFQILSLQGDVAVGLLHGIFRAFLAFYSLQHTVVSRGVVLLRCSSCDLDKELELAVVNDGSGIFWWCCYPDLFIDDVVLRILLRHHIFLQVNMLVRPMRRAFESYFRNVPLNTHIQWHAIKILVITIKVMFIGWHFGWPAVHLSASNWHHNTNSKWHDKTWSTLWRCCWSLVLQQCQDVSGFSGCLEAWSCCGNDWLFTNSRQLAWLYYR